MQVVECSKHELEETARYPCPNAVNDECFFIRFCERNPQILAQGLQYIHSGLVTWRRTPEVDDLFPEEIIGAVFSDVDCGLIGLSNFRERWYFQGKCSRTCGIDRLIRGKG